MTYEVDPTQISWERVVIPLLWSEVGGQKKYSTDPAVPPITLHHPIAILLFYFRNKNHLVQMETESFCTAP